MSRKIFDVRIYPSGQTDFDIIVRLHGGIMKMGSHPTLEAALQAARAVEGKKPGQPVYVYDRGFADLMAEALAPAVHALQARGSHE